MIVKDNNNVPDLLKRIERLSNKAMQIGIFQDGDGGKVHDEDGESDATILQIANVHEFGLKITVTDKMRNYLHYIGIHLKPDTKDINIPERSFIRKAFDEQQSNMGAVIDKLFTKYIDGQIDYDVCMDSIGEYLVGLVKLTIKNMDSPPNAQITIDRKGSSGVLVDTGKLIDSITYKVVEV